MGAMAAADHDVPTVRGAKALLSPQQERILELAGRGHTNAEIARVMYLSIATVERHCTIMYRRLGVRNRAQALAVMARLGATVGARAMDGR